MRFVNLHFPVDNPAGSLFGLWKVTADERYHSLHWEGFPHDGLFLTHKGGGDIYLENDREPIHLPQESCFALPRGTGCHYHKNLYAREWTFHFLEYRFPHILDRTDFPWSRVLPFANPYGRLCETLADEASWNRRGRDGVLEKGLLEILTGIIREEETPAAGMEAVLKWMHGHPDLNCSLEEMIRLSGMTRTNFFLAFKEKTGRTPMEYFHTIKIKAVQSLLLTTNLSLGEIACRMNFCDEYYLSRQFKKETGISPRKWQKYGLNANLQ